MRSILGANFSPSFARWSRGHRSSGQVLVSGRLDWTEGRDIQRARQFEIVFLTGVVACRHFHTVAVAGCQRLEAQTEIQRHRGTGWTAGDHAGALQIQHGVGSSKLVIGTGLHCGAKDSSRRVEDTESSVRFFEKDPKDDVATVADAELQRVEMVPIEWRGYCPGER